MRLFIIFIALVVAVAAGLGSWLMTQDSDNLVQEPQQPQAVAVQEQVILIARQDIPVGKKLDENDIDRQTWPASMVHPDFITQGNEGEAVNKVTRVAFKQGQPLVTSFLANPNDPGFLAAQLPEGMRAVTIPVDAISGINGFVFPGDRVDVLIKHNVALEKDFKDKEVRAQGSNLGEAATTVQHVPLETSYSQPLLMSEDKRRARPQMRLTEVLIPNARVLAVGKAPVQYEGAQASPTNVTLEVSHEQAQMLRHADEGSLSLSLRSLKDAEDTSVPRPVADVDLTNILPPAYFPQVYNKASYPVESVTVEAGEYKMDDEDSGKKGQIAIIRGTKKEIVGVERP